MLRIYRSFYSIFYSSWFLFCQAKGNIVHWVFYIFAGQWLWGRIEHKLVLDYGKFFSCLLDRVNHFDVVIYFELKLCGIVNQFYSRNRTSLYFVVVMIWSSDLEVQVSFTVIWPTAFLINKSKNASIHGICNTRLYSSKRHENCLFFWIIYPLPLSSVFNCQVFQVRTKCEAILIWRTVAQLSFISFLNLLHAVLPNLLKHYH